MLTINVYNLLVSTHTFILLKLNHPEIKNKTENNICFMRLQEALTICDCIYIFNSNNISNSIVSKCELSSKERELPFYCISNRKTQDIKEYFNSILKSHMKDLPLILILQAGLNAQIEKVEIALCNSLTQNNIKYKLHTNTRLAQIDTIVPGANP